MGPGETMAFYDLVSEVPPCMSAAWFTETMPKSRLGSGGVGEKTSPLDGKWQGDG